MALGTPTLATPTVGIAGTSSTTASFTPTLGALLLAFGSSRAAVLVGALTLTPSALTWIPLTAGLHDLGSSTRVRVAAWAAVVSSASAMTLQVSSSSATKTSLSVAQITGAGGIPGNAAANPDPGGTANPTVTLGSAPAAASTVFGYMAALGSTAITAPAGYLELDEFIANTDLISELAYDAGSAATSASWATSNARGVGLLVEVQQSSGGSRVPSRPSSRHMLIR